MWQQQQQQQMTQTNTKMANKVVHKFVTTMKRGLNAAKRKVELCYKK